MYENKQNNYLQVIKTSKVTQLDKHHMYKAIADLFCNQTIGTYNQAFVYEL